MPLFPVDLSSEPVQRRRRKTGSGIQMALFFFFFFFTDGTNIGECDVNVCQQ